jgi:hypothetical protein
MPGKWKINLRERIQSAQLKQIVKILDKGIDELLLDPRLFSESSAIAFSEALRNIEDVSPVKSPLITPAAIGALFRAAHIFQLQAVFQPTFGQASLPARIRATATQTTVQLHSAATYTAV